MKTSITEMLIVVFGYSFAILLPIAVMFMATVSDKEVVKTKCYDRYGSEIIGAECEEVVFNNPILNSLVNILPVLICMSVMAVLSLIFVSISFFGGRA